MRATTHGVGNKKKWCFKTEHFWIKSNIKFFTQAIRLQNLHSIKCVCQFVLVSIFGFVIACDGFIFLSMCVSHFSLCLYFSGQLWNNLWYFCMRDLRRRKKIIVNTAQNRTQFRTEVALRKCLFQCFKTIQNYQNGFY